MVSFENTRAAFAYRSDDDLRQSHALFRIIAHPRLVKWGSAATKLALALRLPITQVVKSTVFRQFVGGETMEEALPTAQKLAQYGVQSILDYSAEGKDDEATFDRTAEIIRASIRYAAQNKEVFPLSVFKPTGVARFGLMERISAGQALTDAESAEWQRAIQRMQSICSLAVELRQPVMIDAEESWIQPAVDAAAEDLMRAYNRGAVWVYSTAQMYRHDRLAYIRQLAEKARREGFFAGMKVVRGAYMEKERLRAKQMGYPSPIQPDKQSTDRDYNLALELILQNLDHMALVAGTHNEESSMALIQLMQAMGISKNDHRVHFSQLYGMSDHISFNLAAAGYPVVKYLPFGPVNDVLPYLIRRAEENTSVAGQTGRELLLIAQELKRRKLDH
jgi:proline dehydrogenase